MKIIEALVRKGKLPGDAEPSNTVYSIVS